MPFDPFQQQSIAQGMPYAISRIRSSILEDTKRELFPHSPQLDFIPRSLDLHPSHIPSKPIIGSSSNSSSSHLEFKLPQYESRKTTEADIAHNRDHYHGERQTITLEEYDRLLAEEVRNSPLTNILRCDLGLRFKLNDKYKIEG